MLLPAAPELHAQAAFRLPVTSVQPHPGICQVPLCSAWFGKDYYRVENHAGLQALQASLLPTWTADSGVQACGWQSAVLQSQCHPAARLPSASAIKAHGSSQDTGPYLKS